MLLILQTKLQTKKAFSLFLLMAMFLMPLTLFAQEYEKLKIGNERFVKEQTIQKDFGNQRTELIKGQHPYAIILSCSDSRVPPEYVFDESLGQLFVIRDAGNVATPEVIGSIEYAVEHLHSKVLVVMAHEKCGAVSAAYEGGKVSANIESILKRIKPSVDKAKQRYKEKDEILKEAAKENAIAQIKTILNNSKIVSDEYKHNVLKIYHAFYNLADGKVEMIEYKD
jgi:carbonic anhydrase